MADSRVPDFTSIPWRIEAPPGGSSAGTVPTPEGGTHEAGFWAAILKGIKAYGELANNRKAAQITREDLISGGCALVSVKRKKSSVFYRLNRFHYLVTIIIFLKFLILG